jgi:glycosyltransferase involved in cell wall biosynthesis
MVSRLDHEKGVERALESTRYVADKQIPIALHIIGGGPVEAFLRERTKDLKINDLVHFYGEQSNPYRYMKNADLFLMTSFHEAAPMVIEEAASLGVPVLTVETTSSREMVTQRKRGWVCANEQEALNEMLAQLLADPGLLQTVKTSLLEATMDNALALEQFSKMIEG